MGVYCTVLYCTVMGDGYGRLALHWHSIGTPHYWRLGGADGDWRLGRSRSGLWALTGDMRYVVCDVMTFNCHVPACDDLTMAQWDGEGRSVRAGRGHART